MRREIALLLWLAAAPAGRAEIIDWIAVTVDRVVITRSEIAGHLRVAAFLEGRPLDLGPEASKTAARQRVEIALIRREIAITRYPMPDAAAVAPALQEIRARRYGNPGGYEAALRAYGISEEDLARGLLEQMTVLRFIEYRFRPGVAVEDAEVEQYYRDEFLPSWNGPPGAGPPPLDDVSDRIEEILTERRVDMLLDEWLEQAAAQASIDYREGALQ